MTTAYDPKVHHTAAGTPYLKEPGVALVAVTQFLPMNAAAFVGSFGDTFDAADYENDWYVDKQGASDNHQLAIDDGAALCKFAGQTCYLSFGEKRTRNDEASAQKYFNNIKSSGHGSVLEHANYSFAIWGIDRACSHEIVRHRAGFAYSQLSQRYVNGKTLRFVERPEYQDDAALHSMFEQHIDRAATEYNARADRLAQFEQFRDEREQLTATERRKAVNQAARNCLPNETETAMVVTGNARAWRHFLEMRGSQHADLPISLVAVRLCEILQEVSPILFGDYVGCAVQGSARVSLSTPYRKV